MFVLCRAWTGKRGRSRPSLLGKSPLAECQSVAMLAIVPCRGMLRFRPLDFIECALFSLARRRLVLVATCDSIGAPMCEVV